MKELKRRGIEEQLVRAIDIYRKQVATKWKNDKRNLGKRLEARLQ